jgi:GYF domain 2
MALWSSNYLPADGPEVCSWLLMSGVYEVVCDGCGQRQVTSAEQARRKRVVRCVCGQFVRLDRALPELRSEPAPAQPVALAPAAEGEEEEATHMLSSLAAVAALSGGSRGSQARASQASMHEHEHGSRPVPAGTLRSSSQAPAKYPSTPPTIDKPLWYVDLGTSETVEMTIEQLIIARRSGKLGEGALVWREGMPRWRPVGTLIPATSVPVSRSTPIPPAPSHPPLPAPGRPPAPSPSRPAPPAPLRTPALGGPGVADLQPLPSYARPLATLEFAPGSLAEAPSASATRSPLPSAPSRPPPRGITPVPRPASWLPTAASSTPRASDPPPALPPGMMVALPRPAAPLPQRSPLPAAPAVPIPTPLPSFTSDRPVDSSLGGGFWDWLGDRPRWVSACIALLVCIAAAGSGAVLVRSLKMHRQPLPLTPTTESGATQPLPGATTPNPVAPLAPVPAVSAPLVVDLQSLSLEPSTPRRALRPVIAVPVPKPADKAEAAEPSLENGDPVDEEPSQGPTDKPKSSDLPSAAHSNADTTDSGSDDSSGTK